MINKTEVGSKGKPTFCKYWNISIDSLQEDYLNIDIAEVNLALAQAFVDEGMYVSRVEGPVPVGDSFKTAYRGIVWTDRSFSDDDMLELIKRLPDPFEDLLVYRQYDTDALLQIEYLCEEEAKQLAKHFPLAEVT